MIGFTFKFSKRNMQILLLAFCVVFLTLTSLLVGMKAENKDKVKISSNATVVEYIETFGWSVEFEPVEKELVLIPSQFSAVYEEYNKLQLEQGFDLRKHKGEEVYRYTYKVTNYGDNENVRVNLLIKKNGTVIGGDICSVELNGFMEKFK